MITAKASASIDWLFEKSVRDNSVLDAGDRCVITAKAEMAAPVDGAKRQLVVLNISSYLFRLVALFDFATDAATMAHLARLSRTPDKALEGQALSDAYAELVNMICGAANRGLCAELQHAGMSTPFLLESSCARYLAALAPTRVKTYEVVINDAVRFDFTVCICVAQASTLDFDIDRTEKQETASSGELELF